jgi:hypothetical protein
LNSLEVEFQRELNNPWIERAPQLPKALTVYVLSFATDEEISVVESVEQLSAEFYVCPLGYPGSFNESYIEIPITWPIDRSQLQRPILTRSRILKKRGISAPVRTYQLRIQEEGTTCCRMYEYASHAPQLVQRERRVDSVPGRTTGAVHRAAG